MSFKATVAAPPQMKPNRPLPPGQERDAPTQQQRLKSRRPGQLPFVAKIVISLLVTWHVAAVFLAPLSIQPSSALVVEITQQPPMQWYLDALYLNHGYHFFAPEPSNGHLIHYTVIDDRNGILAQGEFPSKKDNWPRLLYHRYFMLADQCEVASPTEAEANQWRDDYLKAYARQLLREYPSAAAVRVKRVVHFPLRAIDAIKINDDESLRQYREQPLTYPPTYQDEAEVTQRRSDLDQGQAAATTSWRQDVASGWQGGAR